MRDGARIGLPGAIALVMGGMIGTGIFMMPTNLAPYGWNVVPAWLITIGGCVCIAWLIATLSRRHKEAFGPAEMVEQSFGRTAGFLVTFSYWISCWTSTAALALGALSYLSAPFPIIAAHPAISALCLLWLLTLVNLVSLRLVSSVQVVTTLLKLVPLIAVVVLMLVVVARSGATHVVAPAVGLSLSGTNAAASITLFAMVGFEAACAGSHKIANPQRNVALATMIGTTLAGLVYLLICVGFLFLLPGDALANSPAPFALLIATYWSPDAAAVIGLFAAISAIGALNGWTLIQGEMPLDMARRGMMPGWFAQTGRNGIAVRGLIVSALLSSALVVANASSSLAGIYTFILLLTTSVTLWLYLAVALVALKERVAVGIASIGLAFGIWTLIGTGWEAALLGLALMLGGLPLYWLARREAALDALVPAA